MPGEIKVMVGELLKEGGAIPMDLTRFGLAQMTAYKLAAGEGEGISYDVLIKVCDFLTEKLGRPIDPGDVLKYKRDVPNNIT